MFILTENWRTWYNGDADLESASRFLKFRLQKKIKIKNYRKLQYNEKVFEEFQGLSCFPRKIIFYSSCKFGILKC